MPDKQANCPLCESSETYHYLELPDRFNQVGEFYNIHRCGKCGFIFLHPRIDEKEIAAYYCSEGYDPFLETGEARTFSQRLYGLIKPAALRWKIAKIGRYKPTPGRLLDVGAGTGAFLAELKSRGWNVAGVEKEPIAAAFGREKLGLNIHIGDLIDVEFEDRAFDIISFWHSLEHIHRLRENLVRVGALLKSDGILVVALPNPASLDARFYRRKWVAWDAPRHLWHFKPDVLRRLLSDMDFKLMKMSAMPFDPFYNCLHSEFIVSGGAWWRFPLRFPTISLLSFFTGLIVPALGSSIVYFAERR